jgi:phage terminase large subunit GpA-like protein
MTVEDAIAEVSKLWAPPPRQTVCEWARDNFIVTTGAKKGRFVPNAYQVEPINAIGDPFVNEIVIIAATQMLKTMVILVGIAYVIARDPDPIMVVQPRDSDVSKFSKFRLAPMLREMPALRGLVSDPKARNSATTIDTKDFPGGPLILTAAGSPGNLASYAIRYLFCDEVDKYPLSSGAEGNPIDVANKRTATYRSRRKRIQTCSPTIAGESQITAAYAETDQRKFWVPCPKCGKPQILAWRNVRFEKKGDDIKKRAETAAYACEHCGALWNDVQRWAAVERGEWRADQPFNGAAGFWISELYSPFKTLRELVADFLKAKDNPERLKVFVNTSLAEVWTVQGTAPSWKRLYDRREDYPYSKVPRGAYFLTAFVDVQENPPRLEVEVKAWGQKGENWSIWYEVIAPERPGPGGRPVRCTPADPEPWERLAELIMADWQHVDGGTLPIWACGVDSGYMADTVYSFCRQWAQPAYGPAGALVPSFRTVVPTKGGHNPFKTIESISSIDAAKVRGGLRIVTIGTHCVKQIVYDSLGKDKPLDEQPFPQGYSHHPGAYDESYFQGLTAETRVVTESGAIEWHVNGRNEPLDTAVGNRAMYELCGGLRLSEAAWAALDQQRQDSAAPVVVPAGIPGQTEESRVARPSWMS